jgi:hypothetical protein
MKMVSGRQPPHARERSQAIQLANRRGILFAEVAVDTVLRAIKGEPLGDGLYAIDSPTMPLRTEADHIELAQRTRPAMETMIARWQAIPAGDSIIVSWPDNQAARIERPRRRSHHVDERPSRARSA